ncbi:hypothetical protein ACFV9D_19800 [Streptomyces sp. NPDC059875]|uniref:hypothetical protein n=1 Tax=unclassified Streptomyces TaxID=2593676 RepID=UPI0036575EF5
MPVRLIMPLHGLTTAVIAALAAALGMAVEHADHPLTDAARWLLTGSATAYTALAVVAALATTGTRVPLLAWAVPGLAIPPLLGAFGSRLPAPWLAWVVAALIGWQLLCGRWPAARAARSAPGAGGTRHTG